MSSMTVCDFDECVATKNDHTPPMGLVVSHRQA